MLMLAEATAASGYLDAQRDQLQGTEATVVRRAQQLVLQLSRIELRAELCVEIPESFPLKIAMPAVTDKVPGVPNPCLRNWMRQSRQILSSSRPLSVGWVLLIWAQSFTLFFEGVEDCPICYSVVHVSTQSIPLKACPTCKHKFHSACLQHWFKTSSKSTCPLCNQ